MSGIKDLARQEFSARVRVVEVAEDRFRFLAGGLEVDVRSLRVTMGGSIDCGCFHF